MIFTFARMGAAAGKMRAEDIHETPRRHKLDADLNSYMEALHAGADAKGTSADPKASVLTIDLLKWESRVPSPFRGNTLITVFNQPPIPPTMQS
jgi:hypothetical protein